MLTGTGMAKKKKSEFLVKNLFSNVVVNVLSKKSWHVNDEEKLENPFLFYFFYRHVIFFKCPLKSNGNGNTGEFTM